MGGCGSKPAVNQHLVPSAKKVIAVASGKGGVGKSTVAANLAIAIAKKGNKVAILDADIYGPSVPKIFGTQNEEITTTDEKLNLVEKHGVKTLSIGNLVPASQATIWRGPMVHSVLTQLLNDTNWGELDYLVLDLPPGTGDVQLSISQLLNVDGVVAVSTPQDMSVIDVQKCVNMFQKVNIKISGIVENMSYFMCDSCDKRHHIFGESKVRAYADATGIEMIGEIPINSSILHGSENGVPYAVEDKDSIFESIAGKVIETV